MSDKILHQKMTPDEYERHSQQETAPGRTLGEIDAEIAWIDGVLKDRTPEQQELAPMPPCPHCGESRQGHLWRLLGSRVRCDECGQHYKNEPMPSQAQRAASVEQTASENQRDIAKLQSQLDELHDLIEQQQDGARHLAGRLDKQEAQTKELFDQVGQLVAKGFLKLDSRIDALQEAVTKDITGLQKETGTILDILDTVTTLGKDMGRGLDSLLAHHPQCQKPTIAEQCAASWPREEGDRE